MTSFQEFWSIRPKCFLFFPAIIPVIQNSENNHGKPNHFAIPAIPRPGCFYIATMGLKKKPEETHDLSSVMDDAGWKNEEICMKQTEGLWRLATKSGNMICFLDFLHFLL